MKSQVFGNFSDKKIMDKINVLSFFLNDEEYTTLKVESELHREILELFAIEGRTCRQISRILRAKYPEQAAANLRRNAKANFGHEGVSRVINRWYLKAFNYYKEKYETTKTTNKQHPEEY